MSRNVEIGAIVSILHYFCLDNSLLMEEDLQGKVQIR